MRQEDEQIGHRIAQARREAGLTQEELSETVGVTKRSIQGYEAGKVVPYRHFERLAEATGRSRRWFLTGEDDEAASALGTVGEQLVALVEQIAAEAERIADVASRLEARLAEQERTRGFGARR